MEAVKALRELCTELGVELDQKRLELFERYLLLLQKWGRVHNLTGELSTEGILKRHFCDSLSLVYFFKKVGYDPTGKGLVDVGTGAGFPGVPLKIYYGDKIRLCLIESVQKKCAFLNHLKVSLGLEFALFCKPAEEVDLSCEVAAARALEVKGRREDPLLYADRLLSQKARELVVILKGKKIDGETARKLGYSIFEIDRPPLEGMKILYKFL